MIFANIINEDSLDEPDTYSIEELIENNDIIHDFNVSVEEASSNIKQVSNGLDILCKSKEVIALEDHVIESNNNHDKDLTNLILTNNNMIYSILGYNNKVISTEDINEHNVVVSVEGVGNVFKNAIASILGWFSNTTKKIKNIAIKADKISEAKKDSFKALASKLSKIKSDLKDSNATLPKDVSKSIIKRFSSYLLFNDVDIIKNVISNKIGEKLLTTMKRVATYTDKKGVEAFKDSITRDMVITSNSRLNLNNETKKVLSTLNNGDKIINNTHIGMFEVVSACDDVLNMVYSSFTPKDDDKAGSLCCFRKFFFLKGTIKSELLPSEEQLSKLKPFTYKSVKGFIDAGITLAVNSGDYKKALNNLCDDVAKIIEQHEFKVPSEYNNNESLIKETEKKINNGGPEAYTSCTSVVATLVVENIKANVKAMSDLEWLISTMMTYYKDK